MTLALNEVARQFFSNPASLFATKPAIVSRVQSVLVADDDESVRNFAALVISALGYEVLQAADGNEALRLLAKREDQPVDLLLTDLMMPVVSGKELAMRIWDRFPMQRVIFFSGYSEPMARRMWRLDHEVIFLQKPFSSHALAAKVRQVLSNSPEPA